MGRDSFVTCKNNKQWIWLAIDINTVQAQSHFFSLNIKMKKFNDQYTILLIENDVMTAVTYKAVLKDEPIFLTHLETGHSIFTYLQNMVPDVMLLDLSLPDMSGMDILKFVYQQQLNCIVIVITMENTVDIIVDAMRSGVYYFIEKPCQANQLLATLRNALHQYQLFQQVELHTEVFKHQQYHDFIGTCQPMQVIYKTINNAATSKVSIFITGGTGTDKELCAEAIPENLLESHLFGHVKGAFTGAHVDQKGLISKANGGTLFLDEIGELPLSTQSALLRFVQNQTFSKVGNHQLEQVDVCLICATNRNLLVEVKAWRFRENLYYRINTIEIKLSALRERWQDIV